MKFSTTSFAAGAVAVLVLGSGTAYAATGGKFILGKSNYAGATSSLTNKNGTALALNSKSGTAPLKVNRTVKVANLNSDFLDGLDSGSFARSSGKTGTIWSDGGFYVDFDGDGWADGLLAFAACPSGTIMTGGGGDDATPEGTLWMTEAIDTGVWAVASSSAPEPGTVPDGTPSDEIWAMAQCYNPKGSVPGASYRSGSVDPITAFKEKLAEKAE